MTTSSLFQILPSSHAKSRETFAASDALERALKAVIKGEVRFDAGSRALYATDASNYRHLPIGLVSSARRRRCDCPLWRCAASTMRQFSRGGRGLRWRGSAAMWR